MARLLMASDDHYGSLAAVRALKAAGHEPWVAHPSRLVYAALSRASAGSVRVPSAAEEPDAFAAALAAAARSLGAAAVLPASEASLTALAGRERDFGGTTLAVGPAASVARASDKLRLAELAAAAGLEAPPTRTVRRAEIAGADVPFPAIAKPARSLVELEGGGGRRRAWARRIDSREQLARLAADEVAEWAVQPYLEGALYAVGGVAWRGRLVCAVHQVARRLWPPSSGGSSFAVTVPPDRALEAAVETILAELDWSGIFQAQLIAAGGGMYLIDLNLRIYGSLALATAAGLNLPGIWAGLLLGREPEEVGGYRPGVSFRAPEKDLRALWREFRQGRRAQAARGLLPHRPGVQSVFSAADPLPLVATAAKAGALLRRR